MSTARFEDSFWTDPKVKDLDLETKLIFVWLFTNPYRNWTGIYYHPKPLISLGTGISDRGIDRGINTLIDRGVISYSEAFQVVFVKNMFRHQNSSAKNLSDQQTKGIISHLKTLHNCPLIKDFLEKYADYKIPFEYIPPDTPMDTPMDTQSQSQSQSQPSTMSNDIESTPSAFHPTARGRRVSFGANALGKLWNELASQALPRVMLPLKNGRVNKYRPALKDHPDPAWWGELIARVNQIPGLCGENDRGWRADLDFVVRKRTEISEGKYDHWGTKTKEPQMLNTVREWYRERETPGS